MLIKILFGLVILSIVAAIVICVLVVSKPEMFKSKKTKYNYDSSGGKTGTDGNFSNTADFIPFVDIKNNILDLGNYNLRTILECSSINYDLLSDEEQNTEDILFTRCLNSISFPFEIYIQTREIDMGTKIKELEKQMEKTKKKFPQCSYYADNYLTYMKELTKLTGNSKIKKKYFIISFNSSEVKEMSYLSPEEIVSFNESQIMNRTNIVASCLKSAGLSVKLLDKSEICEVMYSYYHRDRYTVAKDIVKGAYDSLVINRTDEKNPNERQILDSILAEVQNRIKTELVTADSTDMEISYYKYIYDVLECFKQDDKISSVTELMEKSYENVNADTKSEFDAYISTHAEPHNEKGEKINTYFDEYPERNIKDGTTVENYEEE